MELLLPALIVAVWLVLSHIRKQQFLKDYMARQHKAVEKGVALPGDLNEIASAKTDWAAVNLRVGIISLVLGKEMISPHPWPLSEEEGTGMNRNMMITTASPCIESHWPWVVGPH